MWQRTKRIAPFFLVLLSAALAHAQTYTVMRDSSSFTRRYLDYGIKRVWASFGIAGEFNRVTTSPGFYISGSMLKGNLLYSARFLYIETGGDLIFNLGVPDQEYSVLFGKMYATSGLSVGGSIGPGLFHGHMIEEDRNFGVRHGEEYLHPALVAQVDLGVTLYVVGFSLHLLGDLNARRPFGAFVFSTDLGKLWE